MAVSSCRRGARAGTAHKVVVKELNVSCRISLDLQQDHHHHHLPLHCHKHDLGVLRTFLEKIPSALKLNIRWEQKIHVLVRFFYPEFSCVIPSQVFSSSIIRKYGLGKRNCEFLQ